MSTQPPIPDPVRPVSAVLDTRLAEPRLRAVVTATPAGAAPSSLGVEDVYFTLFRHKWKIVICSLLGISAGAAYYFTAKPTFSSNAKLFIRYVVTEAQPAASGASDTVTKSPDRGGETIMTSEQEILTSLDLARKVAETVGPDKINGKDAVKDDINTASVIIRKGLTVSAQRFSSVIGITFVHSDPEVTQAVVREVIAQYRKMHQEIHRSAGMVGEFLAQETDQLRSRLAQTEDDLRKARAKAGVISVEEAKRSYAAQIDALRGQVFAARVEQAQRAAMLKELGRKPATDPKSVGSPSAKSPPSADAVSLPASTLPVAATAPSIAASVAPAVAASSSSANPANPATTSASAPSPPEENEQVPVAVIEEYRGVFARVGFLRKREQEMLLFFTPENPRVKEVQAQLADAEQRRRQLEEETPLLTQAPSAGSPASTASSSPDPAASRAVAMESEVAQLNGLEARIKTLNEQMDTLRKEAVNLDQAEGNIQELTRKRELEEANYRRYAASLEQSRINEALGSGKVSNISVIQTPSPPFIEPAKTLKTAGSIAGGGVGLGLAWAFLIELLLDRSVRRPSEFGKTLRIPLFLSVPLQRLESHRRNKKRKAPAASPAPNDTADAMILLTEEEKRNPLSYHLNPYHETLRDRLIGYFESRNLTHKPKLVALTGLGPDSGVTSIATGLARCFSETGDGNVLLVDLTPGQGSAMHFHRGKPGMGLEELLETRAGAQVQERLYVVSDGSHGDRLSRLLPQRFAKLLPQLKSSDFDYIIFDMPPVSQISITPRLAGFMDIVLLVVESEKTTRENVQRANTLLAESNAHVGAVLNKTKNYVPTWLHHELPV